MKAPQIRLREKAGAAMIEAALVMPLILLFFLGIFEFGRILMIKQIITNAAREGARVGAINLDDDTALANAQEVSRDYLTRSGVDPDTAAVSPEFSEVNGTQAVQMTIGYDYTSTLYAWVPGIPDTLNLQARVIMRREA